MTAPSEMGLRVSDLSCRRHDRLLFEDLSFSLQPGRLLEVRGPNGSGKTSLLRLLCGLREADSGTVHWQGVDIHEDPAAFRAQLCYSGHRPGINGDLSPIENLTLEAAVFGIDRQRIVAALDQLGLAKQHNLPCRSLSAGQRQRVALARLFMRQAPLWILDEPCASLDLEAQRQVQAILSAQAKAGGCVLFTTHQPLPFEDVEVDELMLGATH